MPKIDLQLADTAEAVRRAVSSVVDLCGQCGFAPARLDEVATAVNEALLNAAEHGNRGAGQARVRLAADESGGAVTVEIRDSGRGPEKIPPAPDLAGQISGRDPVTGWGFYLMRCFASEVSSIRESGGGHTVRLRFERIAPPAPVEPHLARPDDAF